MCGLLRPHRSYLAERGFDLDRYDWRKYRYIRLHNFLLAANDLPPALRQAFSEVVPLSTTEAQNLFLEYAAANDWDLGARPDRLTAADLAARAYVERPDLFERVVGTVHVNATVDWEDFFDPSCGQFAERFTPERRVRLPERIGSHWGERGRGRFVEITDFEVRGAHTFVISHGDLIRARSVIAETDDAREVVRNRLEVVDLVQIFPESGRLSIHTRFDADREAYRRIFGEVIWDDPERYRRFATYTPEPLLTHGSEALRHEGIEDLQVRAKKVVFQSPRNKHYRAVITGAKTGAQLDQHVQIARAADLGTIPYLALGFRFRGERGELTVEIKGDNRIGIKRDHPRADALFKFMFQKGFALPIPRGGRS
jgi:hypothetical protein